MIATTQIIHQFYAALAQRDLAAVAALFAEKMDWYIPGAEHLAPWLGKRSHRNDARDFFELLLQNIHSRHFVLEHVVTGESIGVATGEFVSTMLATGKDFHSPFAAIFTIENGLITRYRFLEDSFGLYEALKGDEV